MWTYVIYVFVIHAQQYATHRNKTYYVYVIISGAPPPPIHAINRGIATEGLGTILAGIWGSGNGTNTFGENVGAIGVTKVTFKIKLFRP